MQIDLEKYRALYLDTFLHFCCGEWAEQGRYNLHLPFVDHGWKMATDGRILMAVPTDEPDTQRFDGMNREIYKVPKWDGIENLLMPCLDDWGDDARPWPLMSVNHVIHDRPEDSEYLILDWDREIVIQPHYYWKIERLARSVNRKLEFRICTIEYRIADHETSVQFRSTERTPDGKPALIGVLMVCCHERMQEDHAVRVMLANHRESKGASEDTVRASTEL